MSEPRPIASLTAGLLARKGAARPAMRSQLQGPESAAAAARLHGDDLGWNDFGAGYDPRSAGRPQSTSQVVSIADAIPEAPAEPPAVVRQQQAIAGRMTRAATRQAPFEAQPAARKNALAEGRRAAFTLRLDAERHLALRLAATLTGRSAQQIVTEALDRLIEQCPDVAAIAVQINTRR